MSMRNIKKESIPIRCQMDEELTRRQMKNKTTPGNTTHPNVIEDDASDTPPPAPPQRSRRLALPQYNRANSAILFRNDVVYEMLAHAMEAPKA